MNILQFVQVVEGVQWNRDRASKDVNKLSRKQMFLQVSWCRDARELVPVSEAVCVPACLRAQLVVFEQPWYKGVLSAMILALMVLTGLYGTIPERNN
jgi:hypothetical protein